MEIVIGFVALAVGVRIGFWLRNRQLNRALDGMVLTLDKRIAQRKLQGASSVIITVYPKTTVKA